MNYKVMSRLSESDRNRLNEIETEIQELQLERAKILRNRAVMFEEERDYLASKIPDKDFYVNGRSSLHRKVVMNPRYRALWTGIRIAALHAVFHRDKVPDEATDEQIQLVKQEIIKQIDLLDKVIIQKGLLWC